jgi:ABC-type branched-subunit amino acid transport system ATPase component/branched-subunit amino acid ABC-type transport system permease component
LGDLLPFIIAGITIGSIYALAGMGLVLTYKTTGIFNFAYGSISTVSAFIFYTLNVQHGVPWPIAAVIALAVGGVGLGLVLERLGRQMARLDFTAQVVGTIGLVLIVEALVLIIYGSTIPRIVSQYFPSWSFMVDGTRVFEANVIIFALGLVATGVLYVYLKLARSGLAMRAVVDNPDLLDLAGTNPVKIRRSAWVIGVSLAAAAGILLAPLLPDIDGTDLTLLVVTAFGAAAIGRFSSLPGTYLGGLFLGLVESLLDKYVSSTGWLGGLSASAPFLVLFVILMVTPRHRLVRAQSAVMRKAAEWRAPGSFQAASAVLLLVFLCFVPLFAGANLIGWSTFLATVILFLSLGLLVRTSGQVSLCHVSFMAIGVCTFSHLISAFHLPWLVALLAAGVIVVPIGALLAIPAIRLSGLYLALATLGFGILLNNLFYPESYMFGSEGVALAVPRPDVSWLPVQSDNGYYYFLLVICVAVSLVVVALNRSRLGRLLRGLAESTTALATCGTAVNVTRVVVFCVSAFLAAIAGVLTAGATQVASSDSYAPLLSVTFFAVIIITVGGEPWYAILAAAGYALIPVLFPSNDISNWLTFVFGAAAVGYVLTGGPSGVPPKIRSVVEQLSYPRRRAAPQIAVSGRRVSGSTVSIGSGPMHAIPASISAPSAQSVPAALETSDLSVRFGGLVAVQDVSIKAPHGAITGLIGPNGAGKTTTFNACSGIVRPSGGRVRHDGRDVSRIGVSARARLGLGRTFQQMELFDSLSVRANVAYGREGGFAGRNPLSHLFMQRVQGEQVRTATEQALDLCGLQDIADVPVAVLPTGQRRLVEFARCLAGPFDVLLLDEPSSGLDRVETERFGQVLQRVMQDRQVAVLLVEHDMSLVTAVCSYIYVLDFGQQIYAGTPAEVISSERVREAYLGGGAEIVAAAEMAEG